jgi:hypothetical protein
MRIIQLLIYSARIASRDWLLGVEKAVKWVERM